MQPRRIGPIRSSNPPDIFTLGSHAHSLPADILREASLRLGILSLVGAVLWILADVLYHVAQRAMSPAGDARWLEFRFTDMVAVAGSIISLAVVMSGTSPTTIQTPAHLMALRRFRSVLRTTECPSCHLRNRPRDQRRS